MLDVHPPHTPTHTWRDFFLHIATIVVGLLIAVGLEQTVEAVHHRMEVKEARRALQAEFDDNLLVYRVNLAGTRFLRQEMSDNLATLLFLKQHPGTPEEKLPGTLLWIEDAEYTVDGAWTTAQQSAVTALMPRSEVTQLNTAYVGLRRIDSVEEQVWDATTAAARFSYADPDPTHLSRAQVYKEIELTEACMEANFRWLISMHDLNLEDGRFTPVPAPDGLQGMLGSPRTHEDLQKLAVVQKSTDDRQKPSWDAVLAAEQIRKDHAKTLHE